MDDPGEPPNPGELHKARSLPKLNVEEAEEVNPGHRYLTPQPTKRKPFLPPKPPPSKRNSLRRSFNLPREHDIPEHPDVEHEETFLDTFSDHAVTPNSMKTERTHENERLEEAKRDLVASSGPLTPKRKAPQPPANRAGRRRKSDTNAPDLRHMRRVGKSRAKSMGPQGVLSSDSDLSSSPDVFPAKKRSFYTPQPKRKQFNINRNKSFDSFDIVQGSRSPVERLAKSKLFRKGLGSSSSTDSTPSPVPQSVSPVFSPSAPRSPSSLSSQQSFSSSSGTPSTASPKNLPISPLASPLRVTNTQKSPQSVITWQATVNTPNEQRPQRRISRTRSTPPAGNRQKHMRKNTSAPNIQQNRTGSIKKRGKSKSVSQTVTNMLRSSPDRNVDPVQAFGAALNAEHGSSPRQPRRISAPLREELFNHMILNKTEQTTMKVNTLPPASSVAPARQEVLRTNSLDQENTRLIALMARQKSGIEDSHGVFHTQQQKDTSNNDPSSPSSGYISTPSPTSSPRHRPALLRHMSSVSSMKSMKSIFGSREVLNDLFRSDRGAHTTLKAIAGFITGLILGVVLLIGLYYGLQYGLIAALAITGVSTLLMSLALAFTVRARCVALLMLPTLCTQRGRAAFLAIVVALLLNGPINNIFLNANEVSTSMSCSAELAYNQSQQIKEVAAEVFDQYVTNLEKSVVKLQDLADGVRGVFKPIEDGLDAVQGGLNQLQKDAQQALSECQNIANTAESDCNRGSTDKLTQLGQDCRREVTPDEFDRVCQPFDGLSEITSLLCEGYGYGATSLCQVPEFVDDTVDLAIGEIDDVFQQFATDINFTPYFAQRSNQSSTFVHIQEAIEEDIDYVLEFIKYIFSILDKLIALSVVYLLYRSYMYHSDYRTKDKFDNFYITDKFKELDTARKERGKKTLLPLKKSEKVRLVDVTSFRLCKPEKGLFKLGLATLLAHICIAIILILVDYGLYWLLQIVRDNGSIQLDLSGESGVTLEINGDSAMSNFIRDVFAGGIGIDNSYNISYDNTVCLPRGSPPNHGLTVGIGICYLIAMFTVLFQAYALRLRRRIAAYFYPERELERLYFIYNDTLKKRQTLFRFLKDVIKQKMKEHDATQRVSLRVFLADRYPILKKIFKIFHITSEPRMCFGCDSDDDGTFKQCKQCKGLYCEECLKVTNNKCTICGEKFEETQEREDSRQFENSEDGHEIYATIDETTETVFR